VIFKVIFTDGSVEIVHATNAGQARMYAIEHFPDRIPVEIKAAGLGDMMSRRPPLGPSGR
jgi:hypothetical protein